MEEIKNPFLLKAYHSKSLFCDRENEQEILLQNVKNGIDTTIISPRRMGKTGLIFRFFDSLCNDSKIETIYVDIYATRSLSDFIKHLAESILHKFPENTPLGKRFMQLIKGFKPLIGYDAITGEPQIQISYQTEKEKEYTLLGLFQFLDQQNKIIVLAIDEFQQINEFPEKNIEALLRTYMQQLKNVRFLFCGSKRSMMIEMFSSAKRPFFASTQFLTLDKIELSIYKSFIKGLYQQYNKQIDEDALDYILEWTKAHTFYTQSLCNLCFIKSDEKIDVALVKDACYEILKRNESVFFQYRQLLTSAQFNYLIAIAKEGEVSKLTAQQFIAKYEIGTPANSLRICNALVEKELILELPSKEKAAYQVYDVFLSRWLEREF